MIRGLDLSSQKACVVEHISRGCLNSPVVSFTGMISLATNFNETVVVTERILDTFLPARVLVFLFISVVRKLLHDPLFDLIEGHPFIRRVRDSLRYQRRITFGVDLRLDYGRLYCGLVRLCKY